MSTPGTYGSDEPGKRFILFFAFAAAYSFLFVLTSRNPFFLDKDILFSKIACWLTENRFSPVLPDHTDPGYPPTLGYMLAVAWSVFGKSLFVSHALMLPFVLGLIWQSFRLLSLLMPGKALLPSMLIVLADSTLLAQSTLFSADVALLFFFLLAINAVIRDGRIWLVLAVTGLVFIHMRGIFLLAAVFLFDQFRSGNKDLSLQARIRMGLSYLPAMLLLGSWLYFHQVTKGWTGYAPDSPWKDSLTGVDLTGFLRNVLVVAWRLVDLGKVFIWAVLAYFVFRSLRHNRETRCNLRHVLFKFRNLKNETCNDLHDLLLMLFLVLLVSVPSMLLYRSLSGHRYFMAINFMASALAVRLIYTVNLRKATRGLLIGVMLTGLLSGHFWVYPDRIAKGWDASLAYLPYHHLRSEMIRYIEQKHIPFEEVGSESPNTIVFKYIDLSGDERSFERASLERHRYVFWSNVYNMFTDEELDALKSCWKVEKEFRCMQVVVRLYRNPDI